MCIRDSKYANSQAYLDDLMTEFDRQKKSNAPIMQAYHGVDVLIIDDTVSYTHLDVYKRQGNARLGVQELRDLLVGTAGAGKHARGRVGAVSYTHLDVYKRQA